MSRDHFSPDATFIEERAWIVSAEAIDHRERRRYDSASLLR
jgi:hypothetical protein